MKFYTDVSGNYLGAIDNSNIALGGFIEVGNPDANPPDVLYNGQFIPALHDAKIARLQQLVKEYEAAISVSVTYTTVGGIEKIYQADEVSRYNVIAMNLAYKDGTPEGFYWKSEDNTKVTPSFKFIFGSITLVLLTLPVLISSTAMNFVASGY